MTTSSTKEGTSEHLEELAKLNVFRWLMWVFFNWGVIVGTLAVAGMVNHLLLYIAAVLIIGNRAHALALLGHDGAHGLVHKNLVINDLLAGLFCFWPFGVGVGGYRRFHFQHHKHVGTENDPELHHKRLAKPNWDLPATIQRIVRRTGLDLVGLGFKEVFLIFYFIGKPAKPIDVIGPALLWIVVLTFIFITQWWWILIVWFIALGTCFWATFRLRMWTEHVGTPGTHRISVTWWQRLLFAPHNTWCHYEHHRWTNIPFWNLPKARKLDTSTDVITLNEVFKNYRTSHPIPSGKPLK